MMPLEFEFFIKGSVGFFYFM